MFFYKTQICIWIFHKRTTQQFRLPWRGPQKRPNWICSRVFGIIAEYHAIFHKAIQILSIDSIPESQFRLCSMGWCTRTSLTLFNVFIVRVNKTDDRIFTILKFRASFDTSISLIDNIDRIFEKAHTLTNTHKSLKVPLLENRPLFSLCGQWVVGWQVWMSRHRERKIIQFYSCTDNN